MRLIFGNTKNMKMRWKNSPKGKEKIYFGKNKAIYIATKYIIGLMRNQKKE
jgi:hypothetical protein